MERNGAVGPSAAGGSWGDSQKKPIVPGTDPTRPVTTDGCRYADTGELTEYGVTQEKTRRVRYLATGSAGQRDGQNYAVIDTQDLQGGKGMRRVSFHRSFKKAQAEAKRLNEQEESERKK